ncbi:hypothetical protein BGZ95_009545 [Linnemannia exigua]|uniref:Secreted protein n=1 Tax=Linnemannia exigua TaxID=604196 RepID=A0AAD4DCS7_9FUNG|nr:hypothetical protein BGZ95_009545 [Linnemannia exigua]
MRFTIAASAAVLLSVASVINAQDAACQAVLNDYTPIGAGAYQKCYTNQIYNTALVNAGATPDYKALVEGVCSKSECSASTLASAETKYLAACNASLAVESGKGNILQLGKTALDVFFAKPIRDAYCALDPKAPQPAPATPTTPAIPPTYCLASSIDNPSSRFYWTNLVPAYNAACNTKLVQTWPAGTLNVTIPNVPSPSVTAPTTAISTPTGSAGASNPTGTNAAGSLKPAAGVATAVLMVIAALF